MNETVATNNPVDYVIETSNIFFLLRILRQSGGTDHDKTASSPLPYRKGNTIIHRMIPTNPAANSIYIRPPQISIEMSCNKRQSIDLIPIPEASSRAKADAWFDEIGKYYAEDPLVIDYAIVRVGYEWLERV